MQAQQIADNAEPAEPGNDGSSMTANDVIADANARSSDEDPEATEVAEADTAAISKMDRFQLSKLLNADDLCVDSEESVFSCVHYWLQQR